MFATKNEKTKKVSFNLTKEPQELKKDSRIVGVNLKEERDRRGEIIYKVPLKKNKCESCDIVLGNTEAVNRVEIRTSKDQTVEVDLEGDTTAPETHLFLRSRKRKCIVLKLVEEDLRDSETEEEDNRQRIRIEVDNNRVK